MAHNQFYDGGFSNYGSSPPNILDHAPIVYPHAYAPLYIDFTQPVNNLKFYILAVDDLRPAIAQINIYQNHSSTPSATRNIPGYGYFYIPVPIDVGSWGYNNVTRIEIVNITDTQGIGYDDFTFSVASPTPTPTPTPTPAASPTPFPPTNLQGEGHIEEITLVWDLQANTTSYNVKRRASFDPSWTTIATGVQPTTFTSFGNTQLIGRYRDYDANPDINYSYAVTAANPNGESLDSNVVSAMIESSCGNFQPDQGPVGQFYPDRGDGWTFTANVNGSDGLVMTDVSLKGRYMAKMMSAPYFVVKTSKMPSPQRGELTANSDSPIMRARLLRYRTPIWFSSTDGHAVERHFLAEYAVDRLTPTSKSCLLITQDYVFEEARPGDQCEPSATVACSRFYPKVSYRFRGRGGETLESLNVAQRLHYRVDGSLEDSIGLFRDCDVVPCAGPRLSFVERSNPVTVEGAFNVVKNGRDAGSWDNIHQTQFDRVDEPPADLLHGVFGGCPDCVHVHWRWGAFFRGFPFYYPLAGYEIIGNHPSYFFTTNQDVDIGLVRYMPGEEHPVNFRSLVNNENLRNLVIRTGGARPRTQVLRPADVLYWYSATSYEPEADLFFKHGSWFNPEFRRDVTVANSSDSQGYSAQAIQNGIRSITYGHIYKDGATTFSNIDPNTLPALPAGYAELDDRVYRISTEAVVSGPNVVSFDVPSINDQIVFNNLAIFHLEQDPFDPDNVIWVDEAIASPDTPAPDFTNRILSARIPDAGYFAIGVLVQPQPDPGSSDLSISVNHSASTVIVEDNLSYTLHVVNAGPQTSTGMGVVDVLPLETTFMSASSSQGTCKYNDGSVYCKLGTIASGGSADITIITNTFEDKAGIQSPGRTLINTAVVAGGNNDANLNNNSASDNVTLLPNPNPRPSVAITSPATGTSYSGPTATVNFTAATGGNISRVDFYDKNAFIGAGSGGSNQYQFSWNANSGAHTIVAVSTATNGRINTSDPVNIFVNGSATISITSPAANSLFDPSANLTITANTGGPVSKVEFFANSISLGQASGANPYSLACNLRTGTYTLTAVATDTSGAITVSAPVNVSVTDRPVVSIASPMDGTTYPISSRVAVMATAQDPDGFISKVDFYANGSLIGTGSFIGQDRFSIDWTDTAPGIYSLTAVATDNLGVSTTSPAITIGVNTASPRAGEFIWFDDDVPPGAMKHADGEDWYWVDANPGSFSGTKAHQSRNSAQLASSPTSSGSQMCAEGGCGPTGDEIRFHQHYFDGATTTLPVNAEDKLFTYLFLDINNMPREIMLQWKDANSWEHRAYWGENRINSGANGTNSRRYMGPIPKAGTWVRLEIPASAVGLEGSTLNGMAFTLDAGRATFDLAGKTIANAAPPPVTPPGDSVWIEDGLPSGSVTAGVNDIWNWVVGPVYSGQTAHQSHGGEKYQSHSFTGAQTPMTVNPGDVLFTYVYLGDPDLTRNAKTPDQIMLQWYDGTSWEHRAFWGENYIGQQFRSLGVQGTESQRFMGGLPAARGWYRLEVPASYVGLEGKTVSGMAFSVYRDKNDPFVTWDRSGKSPQLTTVPLPLSATTGVWRLFSNTYGYAFETNDQGPPDHFPQKKDVFFVHPNQAAGTVPFYRFRRPNLATPEYFYSRCKECYDGNGWTFDGIAFYVFSDATTPGTVPLYLYHDSHVHYFLTINQSEAAGMTLDGIAAYVFSGNPLAPAAPSYLYWDGIFLRWRDNSATETGFKLEGSNSSGWTQIATVAANTTFFKLGSLSSSFSYFRVRATNSFGDSAYSDPACACWMENITVPDAAPEVSIISPGDGDTVGTDFTITANAFDIEGNGTIAKVEFFANGNKLGEVTDPPYLFVWNNVTPGTYSLTAKATDTADATTTSAPVNVTVPKFDQTIAFDPISDKTYGDVPFAINATASSGLPVSFAVVSGPASISGNTVTITGAGPVSIRADQAGNESFNPTQSVAQPFNVAKATATITLSNLSQTYDGTPKTVAATTTPAGLSGVAITYNGSATAPTNAGSYSVVASLTNANYIASDAIGTLNVSGLRTNVALAANGATATASSTLDNGRLPLAAINGDRRGIHWGSDPATGSGWHDATNGTYSDWLQIDFNGSKTIYEVDIFAIQDNYSNPIEPTSDMTFGTYGVTAFDVQYWAGSSWVTVPDGSAIGNNKVWRQFSFPGITTDKIRVLVNGSLAGYSRIVEVEAWSRVNVALAANGATATASSTLDDGRLPLAAINGDRKGVHWGADPSTGSGWHDSTNGVYPDWLQVDFNGSKTIDEIDVFAVQDNYGNPVEPTGTLTFTQYGITDFQVQYWNGFAWAGVTGGNVTGNNLVWRRFNFAQITTTKVRVVISNTPAGPYSYSRIVELEAWGAP